MPPRPAYEIGLMAKSGWGPPSSRGGPGLGVSAQLEPKACEPKDANSKLRLALIEGRATAADYRKFKTLKRCSCGKGAQRVKLAARSQRVGTEMSPGGVKAVYGISYLLFSGTGQPPLWLDVRDPSPIPLQQRGGKSTIAPPGRAYRSFALHWGCDGDVVVMAARSAISGWSVSQRKRIWSADLGGELPAVGGGGRVTVKCKAVKPQAGMVTLELQGGQRVSFRTADGAKLR